MNDTTLIADLIRAGLSPDLVGRVANAINGRATVDSTAEKRRAWDRERKRNRRLSGGMSGGQGVGWNSTGSGGNTETDSFLEDSKTIEDKKERKRGLLCPVDYRPTPSHYQAGALLGFSAPQVDAICDEMRAWSHANANRAVARKADWGLALHGWLKRQRGEGSAPVKPAVVITDEEFARLKALHDAKVARTA